MSKVIIEGATLGKEPDNIATMINLIVTNSLIYSEVALEKKFGYDGTFEYLNAVQRSIKKYFKDFDYR